MNAAMAIVAGPKADGFACSYPDGAFESGQHEDRFEFLCAVEALLQNGFRWSVVIDVPTPLEFSVWYFCVKYGAEFDRSTPDGGVTDQMLRTAGTWRRGLHAANAAARLLYRQYEETP